VTALIFTIAVLLHQLDSTDTAGHDLNLGLFFHSSASADLNEGLKTIKADTLTVYPSGSFHSDWTDLSGEAAVSYTPDSTAYLKPVSAGAFFRWPGAPWFGAGVSTGLINPFLQGLGSPVREWNSYKTNDSIAVTLEAGGLLGFQGEWNQFGDSLTWYSVKSPWLGFGTVEWNGVRENSAQLETVTGFLDLKRVQPWFLFVKENSRWTYSLQVRGWKPFTGSMLSVEVAPLVSLGEDSSAAGITAWLYGNGRAFSGYFTAVSALENEPEPRFEAGLNILSQAGIEWALEADLDRLETFHGELSGFYRMSPAGCGGRIELFDDSLRATATAMYSPVESVSAEFSVMSDLDTDSPEPGCLLQVFGARDDIIARVAVEWERGSTTLGMGVSAWID
jgi:hypothetical protein